MSSLFTKEEMLKMIKHLCDEFEGASITQNKKSNRSLPGTYCFAQ